MARPAPHILLENRDNTAHQIEQVLEADAIYAVFYDGTPINLKTINFMVANPGPRYKKTSFSNPGHAVNLAERLNEQYNTDKFAVHKLVMGELYVENKKSNF